MYEPKTGRAMAHRVVEALRQNSRVIVGDSPGRAGRPAFLQKLKELGLESAKFEDTVGRTCSGPRHDLICGKDSASVSDTPKELSVAIMDLDPSILPPDFIALSNALRKFHTKTVESARRVWNREGKTLTSNGCYSAEKTSWELFDTTTVCLKVEQRSGQIG
eukprot:CAMPEP_0117058162 /NCGR_PEP_ID=MMETSP0472-20121206/40406_1 /TAXON_ID=693140 ORGANISM="Tiarina fusus, Strain LIS" /NCGR_SAMPLE_ID=MMETSP0472 /ASSEMBLY_ACC=CAM_ASM_000603 /LENGTH=161 /DNA_ID=CAMNT_0004775383 /DNA_START=124 /DNA_END=605 /DNA_ORIENTATION=+